MIVKPRCERVIRAYASRNRSPKPIAKASRASAVGSAKDRKPAAASKAAPSTHPTVKPTITGKVHRPGASLGDPGIIAADRHLAKVQQK
jgi:hypothetical protein